MASRIARALVVTGLAVVLAACSGGSEDVSEPVATTVAAPTTETAEPTSTTAAPTTESTVAETPTGAAAFEQIVLPVIEGSCVSCHAAGQAGADHFELATVADVIASAPEIRLQVAAGVMPPWPASPLSVAFQDDLSLTDEQIDAIVAWVNEGAPTDIDPATPLVSRRPPSRLENPDVVMTATGGPYTGSTSKPDDYRCLVFEPGNSEKEWIIASHFEPDQTSVVHHGIVTMATAELRDRAAELDAAEPGPGWTCYGDTGLRAAGVGQEFQIGGWAPGAEPSRRPEGYATPLPPGAFIVVQIHYHYDDETPADLSRYVLDLASDDEIEAAGGAFDELTGQLYLGPAEIPCYEGDPEPLCDRTKALERVRTLYGDFIGSVPDLLNMACGVTAADFAGMTDGNASSTCDLPVGNPGRIVSLTGHMHELGQSVRITLNPDTPDEQILLDIPDWDFEWQFHYRPVDDIVIERDDVIRVDCGWNRERAPYEAVGYILWADGTSDEMCYTSITTAPID